MRLLNTAGIYNNGITTDLSNNVYVADTIDKKINMYLIIFS